MSKDFDKKLDEVCMQYEDDVLEARTDAYEEGYEIGFEEGKQEGFISGYEAGQQEVNPT